jgi:hypothetical protein
MTIMGGTTDPDSMSGSCGVGNSSDFLVRMVSSGCVADTYLYRLSSVVGFYLLSFVASLVSFVLIISILSVCLNTKDEGVESD